MNLRILIFTVFSLFFLGGKQVYANTNDIFSYADITNDNTDASIEKVNKDYLVKVIRFQEDNLNKINIDYQRQSSDLKKLQDDYSDLKQNLAIQDKSDELTTFSSWASVLLTSVAVIVTVLGVIIALISFFGYKGIGKQAEKAAEKAIQDKLDGIAIAEFEKLVQEGRLNAQIQNAVAIYLRNDRENRDVAIYPELERELQNED